MRLQLIAAAATSLLFFAACGGGEEKNDDDSSSAPSSMVQRDAPQSTGSDKGIGKFDNVELSPTIDAAMADAGKQVYEVKCASCHKLSDERLVGPGWKGATSRHTPEWIMNFSTNVDEMLDKDPKAMAMLEECLVRMPNQNLSDEDARHVLEFMRQNDGVQ